MEGKNYLDFFKGINLKSTFIGILLTFVLAKFLNPVFEFFYSSLLGIKGSLINSISDSTYKQISKGFSEQESMFILYCLFISACYLFLYILEKLRSTYSAYIDSISSLEQSAKTAPPSKVNDSECQIPETLEQIELYTEDLKQKYKELKLLHEETKSKVIQSTSRIRKKAKRELMLYIGMMFMVFVAFSFAYGRQAFINNKITKVTNNIEIISPYINDTDYKILKSEFYSINSADDYKKLTNKISDFADSHSIVLKE